jgi:hypothetical protein
MNTVSFLFFHDVRSEFIDDVSELAVGLIFTGEFRNVVGKLASHIVEK